MGRIVQRKIIVTATVETSSKCCSNHNGLRNNIDVQINIHTEGKQIHKLDTRMEWHNIQSENGY